MNHAHALTRPVLVVALARAGDYEKVAAFARSVGAPVAPGAHATALGLRGLTDRGERHETHVRAAYDDALVLLTADRRATVVPCATHPWQAEASGRRAMLLPAGQYRAERAGERIGKLPAFLVLGPDGRALGGPLSVMAFHVGEAIPAIGCQVIPPGEYRRFAADVGHAFAYVLLEAGT